MINIAIVDDEVQILDMLENYFQRLEGYSVKTFQSPSQAISAIKPDNVDLVLLDIMMPQMDGLEILEKLRYTMPTLPIMPLKIKTIFLKI